MTAVDEDLLLVTSKQCANQVKSVKSRITRSTGILTTLTVGLIGVVLYAVADSRHAKEVTHSVERDFTAHEARQDSDMSHVKEALTEIKTEQKEEFADIKLEQRSQRAMIEDLWKSNGNH